MSCGHPNPEHAKFCLECGARLARLRGDQRAAEREIDQARRLYAEMGATAQVARLSAETGR